jgi:hypothetical protein
MRSFHFQSPYTTTTMLRRFKARKARPSPEQAIFQTPKLPFEVLFRIIDQEFAAATTREAKISVIANIGRTCRELAIHCRALLFRFVHLALYFDAEPWTDRKQTRRFAQLTSCYPHIISLVEHLSLYLYQSSRRVRTKDRLYDAATRRGASRRKEWLGIMTAICPNLKILTLTSPVWAILHQEIKEAIIKVLLQQQNLEVLTFNLQRWPANILQYCPPTVKYLSYENCAAGELLSSPPRQERPRLEGFTFIGNCGAPPGCEGWLAHITSMVDLGSLKSMQLWPIDGFPGFCAFGTGVQPFSTTLRCLHLLGTCDSLYSRSTMPPPHLDLSSLHALQLFEVVIDVDELVKGLEWISKSLATVPLRRRADRTNGVALITCIQSMHNPSEAVHAIVADAWSQVQVDEWPIIQQTANVYIFSEHCEYSGYRNGNILGLFPREPVAHSALLATLCSCGAKDNRGATPVSLSSIAYSYINNTII